MEVWKTSFLHKPVVFRFHVIIYTRSTVPPQMIPSQTCTVYAVISQTLGALGVAYNLKGVLKKERT